MTFVSGRKFEVSDTCRRRKMKIGKVRSVSLGRLISLQFSLMQYSSDKFSAIQFRSVQVTSDQLSPVYSCTVQFSSVQMECYEMRSSHLMFCELDELDRNAFEVIRS